MVDSDLYEGNFPCFNGALGEDYQLSGLGQEVALESRQQISAFSNENVDKMSIRSARVALISAIGDNRLRVIKVCTSLKRAWEKLGTRYRCK